MFDFLKRKLQGGPSRAQKPATGPDADYEERRAAAEELYAQGRSAEAIKVLEDLAGDLAGAGNFTLAVAVRHQMHRWMPERAATETPSDEGKRMAVQRAKSGVFARPVSRTASSVQRIVRATAFLEELTSEEISGLIESTGLSTYGAEQVVVKEGTPGDRLYVVTRGVLMVTTASPSGDEVRVGTLNVGDFFGEVALLTGRPRAATVTAETDAECLQITKEEWDRLSSRHPRLTSLLEEAMSVRAQLSAEAVVDDLRRRRQVEA